MRIEIDQSGKIEQLNSDTCIACSNEDNYCVVIPKQIKQTIHYDHKNRVKQIKLKLFCIGIYYCISKFLNRKPTIILDNEYEGNESIVKYLLLELLRNQKIPFDKRLIQVSRIGKSSNAHILAINTQRGELKPNKTLSENDITKVLKWFRGQATPALSRFIPSDMLGRVAGHPSSMLNMLNKYINLSLKNEAK